MHPLQQLEFTQEVRDGLCASGQKTLPTRFLYDEVGSALFDAITALPEYGLSRADMRLLGRIARDLALLSGGVRHVVELGSGNGTKTRIMLSAFAENGVDVVYSPVDLSRTALDACAKELTGFRVEPIQADFLTGLEMAARGRSIESGLLVLFLGSNIGNFPRSTIPAFFRSVRACLSPGDELLIGADLVKPVADLLLAYDDPAGVTAAFNRNLLSRVNRTLDADFDVRAFEHEARWNSAERRVEMHLCARSDQQVRIGALGREITIAAGESIHTESSHKFTVEELVQDSLPSGFSLVHSWIDDEWPFAELLFRAL
ncbi:MAG TPA: L-histidine N(alpha)-methyltransferase [Bryobacteraceae bacterium]|nr:L-histidine N(alpha)-methyltransferase [Bryobacteraceae bacterium]